MLSALTSFASLYAARTEEVIYLPVGDVPSGVRSFVVGGLERGVEYDYRLETLSVDLPSAVLSEGKGVSGGKS